MGTVRRRRDDPQADGTPGPTLSVLVPARPVEWVDLGCGLGPVPRRTEPRRSAWSDPDRLLAAAAVLAVLAAILTR